MNTRATTNNNTSAQNEEQLIRCRVIGHAWDEYTPPDKGRPPFGVRLSLICTRCTTERHDIIDFHGSVASRTYEYPNGYQEAGEIDFDDAYTRREHYRQIMLRDRFRKAVRS